MENIITQLNSLLKRIGMDKVVEQSDDAVLSEIIDSLEFIKMLVEIENEFDILIEDDDLSFDKFKMKKDICPYIASKKSHNGVGTL